MFDFGADLPLTVRFLIAFVIVLLLIGVTFWLIRRFGTDRLGAGSARGRQPRLAVIDAAAVDGRRRLVLIRRDNVEHLIMIGGPSDVVIEQNIVRAVPVATPREMPAPARGPSSPEAHHEPVPRPGEEHWEPGTPSPMPPRAGRPRMPEPLHAEPSPMRTPEPEETWRPPPVSAPGPRSAEPVPRAPHPMELTPRREPLPHAEPGTLAPSSRPFPGEPSREEMIPKSADAASDVARSPPTADANLADMAQRLEAALRRPMVPGAEARPVPPQPRPPGAPTADAAQPRPPESGRADAPRPQAPEARHTAEPKPPQPKSVFDSLEEEMASLLGRPKSKE